MTRRDEFDEETFLDTILNQSNKRGSPGSLRRVLAVTAGLAVLGILGAVMWSTFSGDQDRSAEAVPIIRADADPYKIAPQDPGGMAVPNKDSTIFETLKGEQESDRAKLENLFEDAEKPVRKEDVFAAGKTEEPAPQTSEAAKTVVSRMPKMPTVTYEAADSADNDATPPVDIESAAKELPAGEPPQPVASKETSKPPVPEVDTSAAEAPKAAAIQPAAGGNFYVQMAAVKSEADARAQWPKIQAQYRELSDLSLRVQEADLGAKGIYYRIQGGPLTEADARKLCSSINSRKSGSCVVAKR